MKKSGWIIEDEWIYILHRWLNEEFGVRMHLGQTVGLWLNRLGVCFGWMHDTWMRCLTGLNRVFGDGWVGGWLDGSLVLDG